jgi:hypothetical protein
VKDRLLLFVHGLGGAGEATWRDGSRPGFPELIGADDALRDSAEVAFFDTQRLYCASHSPEPRRESATWQKASAARSKYGIPTTNRLRLSAIVWVA